MTREDLLPDPLLVDFFELRIDELERRVAELRKAGRSRPRSRRRQIRRMLLAYRLAAGIRDIAWTIETETTTAAHRLREKPK
jgi:hypothetical protein